MRRSERGLAVLEAAAWLTVLLPCAVLGASLCLQLYDERTMAVIPEAVLREASLPSLRWISDGADGGFGLDTGELRASAAQLVAAASQEAFASVVHTTDISARACCWIFRVDEATGVAASLESQECVSTGSMQLAAELDAAFSRTAVPRVGAPADGAAEGDAGFVGRALVVGLAVGGVFSPPVAALPESEIAQVHIAYPRQEITL